MRHHTVTATFSASADEVFAYLANVDNLPEWATEFARERAVTIDIFNDRELVPRLVRSGGPYLATRCRPGCRRGGRSARPSGGAGARRFGSGARGVLHAP
jgi:hypothetical protein